MSSKLGDKVMTATEAVSRYVVQGSVVGIGGQTTGRTSMVLAHEIVRQSVNSLTLVGCSLSVSMDIIVGAGLATQTECGTGNVEMFGTTFAWRRAIEQGKLKSKDYSHLAMGLRFLAASLGLPFMPCKSMLGTDILKQRPDASEEDFVVTENPWNPGEPVVLLPALSPDVSIIHAQTADEMGNVIIDGFKTHEVEMAKASKAVIVSCEKIVSSEDVRSDSDRTTIPYIYVDAVVEQPWGAFPTSCYRHYEHDSSHIQHYQSCAKIGGESYAEYLKFYVYDCATFKEFLEKAAGFERLKEISQSMQSLL